MCIVGILAYILGKDVRDDELFEHIWYIESGGREAVVDQGIKDSAKVYV